MRYPIPMALSIALAMSGAGCIAQRASVDVEDPFDLEVQALVEATRNEATGDRWWTEFDDPQLNAVVQSALAGNFDVRRAWTRLDQQMAAIRASRSGWFPSVQLEASGSRNEQLIQFGPQPQVIDITTYSVGLSASYEIDMWGRVRAGRDAAEFDAAAARQDIEAAAMTVAANVVEAYIDVRYARAQRELLEEQLELARTYEELTLLRLSQGQASAVEVYQQQSQIRSLETQLPSIATSEQLAQHRLAVLMGQIPGESVVDPDGTMPSPIALPADGIPADLLQMRPDVRAAEARALAADQRVVQAVAAQLPSLRLSAGLTTTSPDLGGLFDQFLTSIAGSLTAPLFAGGQLRAQADQARAARQDAILGYGQSILNAATEIQNALAELEQQRELVSRIDAQMEVAEASLEAARVQYAQGIIEYLPVLTALQSLQTIERSRLDAERRLLSLQVTLNRALGGSWTQEVTRAESASEAS